MKAAGVGGRLRHRDSSQELSRGKKRSSLGPRRLLLSLLYSRDAKKLDLLRLDG